MDRKLTLVGVLHTDINGKSRLERAIKEINPASLTFELDENHGLRSDNIKRDEVMESEIRGIWNSGIGDLMHTGGNIHIFGNYPNLYERLKELNPARYRLNEFNAAA